MTKRLVCKFRQNISTQLSRHSFDTASPSPPSAVPDPTPNDDVLTHPHDNSPGTHTPPVSGRPGRDSKQTVIVTGASSGIGRATAITLATAGWKHIGVHYRSNRDGAESTTAVIKSLGSKATLIAGDIATETGRGAIVQSAQTLGSVDAWVHNAGADVLTGSIAGGSFAEKLDLLWRVDAAGTFDLVRRIRTSALPPPQSIVFLGWDQSTAGMEGDAGQMFGPIKAAVTAFAHSLAQDLAPQTRVNIVSPGWIRTAWGETSDGYWDRRAREQSLIGRWGTPEDVASAITYLCDPAASAFVTGQNLAINGGWNRRFERT